VNNTARLIISWLRPFADYSERDSSLRSGSTARRCPGSIELDVIKRGRVLENDLVGHVLRNALEILLDHLQRIGPGRVSMGKIRRPHIVVLAEVLVSHRPDRIVLES